MTNVKTDQPTGETLSISSMGVQGSGAIVSSTTTTQVHGVTFQTDPGAVVTVDAHIGNFHDSSFLFFVQDGQVNGGYSGRLTNPLQFVGKTP
jgi:hypothetical protein